MTRRRADRGSPAEAISGSAKMVHPIETEPDATVSDGADARARRSCTSSNALAAARATGIARTHQDRVLACCGPHLQPVRRRREHCRVSRSRCVCADASESVTVPALSGAQSVLRRGPERDALTPIRIACMLPAARGPVPSALPNRLYVLNTSGSSSVRGNP